MKRYVVLNKKVGDTPLAALSAWKESNPAYKEVPASYAGRLDPMASGKLLILLGDECKKQKNYTKLDKEYEIEPLVDVGSDTGDALGLVNRSAQETRIDDASLKLILKNEEGKCERPYPAYSSKTVNGKPLFLYALEGKLGEIQIPTHEERIYKIKLLSMQRLNAAELRERITAFLARVPKTDEPSKALGADFRIDAVRTSWEKVLEDGREYALIRLRVACGSGTYMRSLAGRIGEALGTYALALSIHRTKLGKRAGGFWPTRY
jgi:tRNA pseudouridine55 synthase